MKLPENYQNWIEFAKHANELLKENPQATTIRIDNTRIGGNYNIYNPSAIKAKAFDEVMELAIAAKEEVKSLQNSIGTDMAIMTRFLILLTNGNN